MPSKDELVAGLFLLEEHRPTRLTECTSPLPHKHTHYPGHTSPRPQLGYPPDGPQEPREHTSAHFNPSGRSSSSQSPASESSNRDDRRPRGPSRVSTSTEDTTLEKYGFNYSTGIIDVAMQYNTRCLNVYVSSEDPSSVKADLPFGGFPAFSLFRLLRMTFSKSSNTRLTGKGYDVF